jgi:hypothetical protein
MNITPPDEAPAEALADAEAEALTTTAPETTTLTPGTLTVCPPVQHGVEGGGGGGGGAQQGGAGVQQRAAAGPARARTTRPAAAAIQVLNRASMRAPPKLSRRPQQNPFRSTFVVKAPQGLQQS